METRNRYWILDCILALTAVALGAAALCSFVGFAVPSLSRIALSLEAAVCVAALGVGVMFAAFLWRDQRHSKTLNAIRAHQERHALMLSRASQRIADTLVVAPAASNALETQETPETLLVTSLTDVKAERRMQRRQQACRTAEAATAAAAHWRD